MNIPLSINELVTNINFSKNINLPTNSKEIDEIFNLCIEYAESNDPVATFNLGVMYCRGLGISKDVSRGIHYFKKSGELNNPNGLYCLAVMYNIGCQYIEKDELESMKLYLTASNLGDSYSMIEIGNMYEYGTIIQKEYDLAFEWYQRSAELGNTLAMLHQANMYLFGYGVEKNIQKSYELHVLGEKLGGPEIMHSFGKKIQGGYFSSYITSDIDIKIFNLYKKCIDNKLLTPISCLGKLYRSSNNINIKIQILDILVKYNDLSNLNAKIEIIKLFGNTNKNLFINAWKMSNSEDCSEIYKMEKKQNILNHYPLLPYAITQ
jgi:hypothetical protein